MVKRITTVDELKMLLHDDKDLDELAWLNDEAISVYWRQKDGELKKAEAARLLGTPVNTWDYRAKKLEGRIEFAGIRAEMAESKNVEMPSAAMETPIVAEPIVSETVHAETNASYKNELDLFLEQATREAEISSARKPDLPSYLNKQAFEFHEENLPFTANDDTVESAEKELLDESAMPEIREAAARVIAGGGIQNAIDKAESEEAVESVDTESTAVSQDAVAGQKHFDFSKVAENPIADKNEKKISGELDTMKREMEAMKADFDKRFDEMHAKLETAIRERDDAVRKSVELQHQLDAMSKENERLKNEAALMDTSSRTLKDDADRAMRESARSRAELEKIRAEAIEFKRSAEIASEETEKVKVENATVKSELIALKDAQSQWAVEKAALLDEIAQLKADSENLHKIPEKSEFEISAESLLNEMKAERAEAKKEFESYLAKIKQASASVKTGETQAPVKIKESSASETPKRISAGVANSGEAAMRKQHAMDMLKLVSEVAGTSAIIAEANAHRLADRQAFAAEREAWRSEFSKLPLIIPDEPMKKSVWLAKEAA